MTAGRPDPAVSADPRGARTAGPSGAGSGRLIPAGLDAAIVFLRHGESTFIAEGRFQGQAETPLSRLGQRQAELAARRLAVPTRSPVLPIPTRPPLEIVHSPLRRTTQTAQRVAREITTAHGSRSGHLRPDPGLIEIGQGEWEGLHRSEIESRYSDALAAWRRAPLEANAPGGERVVDVAARVRGALAGLLGRLASAGPAGERSSTTASGYPPAPAPDTPWTLVVGHDGTFKVALLTLLDLPLDRFWTFPFALGGISVVEIRSGLPVLRAHNLIEHLAPLLDERAVAESEERQRSGAL